MRIPLAMIVVALLSAAALAEDPKPPFQDYELTDEKIAQALHADKCPRGMYVFDDRHSRYRSGGMYSGLLLLDSTSNNWASGIFIRVLTPYTWICEQAKEAKRRFKPLTVEDVTEDMRREVLRVYASPGEIMDNARKHGLEDYGMTHVTIRSTAKKDYEVLEPKSAEIVPDWQSVENLDERVTYYPELLVIFDLQQVGEISKLDEKGEIFVALTNNLGKERKLKIKTKHFKTLP